jgi:hypothetical protein
VLRRPLESAQFTSVRFTERLEPCDNRIRAAGFISARAVTFDDIVA